LNAYVIGGTGVLSSGVVRRLVGAGHTVTILTDGRGPLEEPAGVARHMVMDRMEMPARKEVRSALQSADIVVDCICYTKAHARALSAAMDGAGGHLVVISTTLVYPPSATPLKPDAVSTNYQALGRYGARKFEMERCWRFEHRGAPVTVLRPPHVVGPGCELGVVPLHNRDVLLSSLIRRGQPLILAGGGEQRMNLVSADDVGRVVCGVAGRAVAFGKTYNCANPDPVTALEYFETIAARLGADLTVVRLPKALLSSAGWGWEQVASSRLLDTSGLRSDVGFVPNTSLDAAIGPALDYLLSSPDREAQIHQADPSFDADRYCEVLHRLEAELRAGASGVVETLRLLASMRYRTPVDLRMNPRHGA